MSAPSIYVQDSVSPNWPGRLWTNPGDGRDRVRLRT